jgi:hypothetical protein
MTEDEKKAYDEFRTGFTFRDIRQMLWSFDEDPRTWRHVTRHTVLGKWREIKQEMWAHNKPEKFKQEDTGELLFYLQNYEASGM